MEEPPLEESLVEEPPAEEPLVEELPIEEQSLDVVIILSRVFVKSTINK